MKVNGFFFQIPKISPKKMSFWALFTLCTHYARICARNFANFYKDKSCRGRNPGTALFSCTRLSPILQSLYQSAKNTSKIHKKNAPEKPPRKSLKISKKQHPKRRFLFCVLRRKRACFLPQKRAFLARKCVFFAQRVSKNRPFYSLKIHSKIRPKECSYYTSKSLPLPSFLCAFYLFHHLIFWTM